LERGLVVVSHVVVVFFVMLFLPDIWMSDARWLSVSLVPAGCLGLVILGAVLARRRGTRSKPATVPMSSEREDARDSPGGYEQWVKG